MNFNTALKRRASIRNYSDKEVKYDRIIDAIEAASLAPSPGNLPILKYLIVEDEEKIDKIAQACQQPFIKKAPVVIVVCSDPKKVEIMYDERANTYVKHHVGAAIENFLLKITDMKLASCWVGAFSELTIRNALKIPENINIEAVLPVAYESKAPKTKQKPKPNLGNIVYFETYGNKYQKEVRRIGSH